MGNKYIPARGDIVWLKFSPQLGHEQAGYRPALYVSPVKYNEIVGLAIFCPITLQQKGYPFEVKLPQNLEIEGVILTDQIKSLDWKERQLLHLNQNKDLHHRYLLRFGWSLLSPDMLSIS